jgi:hypothetical protein
MQSSDRYEPQRLPVVFMFQPIEYEFVPPARLSEWEADMRNLVGLDVREAPPGGTWSRCNLPREGERAIIEKDDCDVASNHSGFA